MTCPYITPLIFPAIQLWWDQVTDAPEDKRTSVAIEGTSQGVGLGSEGQRQPNSTEGAKEEWKNAQNIEIKKHISLITNNIKPM